MPLRIKKIKPMFTSIVTTGEKYSEDMYDNGLIYAKKGDLRNYQTVLEVGTAVKDIKVGDKVMIDFKHYAVLQYDPNSVKNDMGMNKVKGYRFNWVDLYDGQDNKQECLYLDQRDIVYVFEGEEVQGSKNPIIVPKDKKIVLN